MVTIKDVAKQSGVSVTTVSRALNGYSDVNETTRSTIIQIAENLGYVPNKTAQNLVKKESNMLAIIIFDLDKNGGTDNIVYSILSGMYSFAEKIGYEVMLFTTHSAYKREKSYVEFCRERSITGAVLSGVRLDDPYFEELINTKFPCIMIDGPEEGDMNTISIDSEQAAYDINSLLVQNGHRNIACVAGRKEAVVTERRLNGYKNLLKENSLPIKENYIVYADFLEDIAYEKTFDLINHNPEITAIFCESDMMAVGVIRALNELGKKVPEDISIVGFDNVPIANYMTPRLSTVEQNFYEIGKESARQLLNIIADGSKGKKIITPHKIIERDSISTIKINN